MSPIQQDIRPFERMATIQAVTLNQKHESK